MLIGSSALIVVSLIIYYYYGIKFSFRRDHMLNLYRGLIIGFWGPLYSNYATKKV